MKETLMEWLPDEVYIRNIDTLTPADILDLVSKYLEEKEEAEQKFYKERLEKLNNKESDE